MVDPPLSVDSSSVTVAEVVPDVERVHVHSAELPAIASHESTGSPEAGSVPAVTVNLAQIEVGALLGDMYQNFGVDPPPPPVAP